jgi:FkbM family methyltransferase
MNLINFLQNLYVYFFSKRMFYFLNKSLLHLTLKCLGYKNHGSFFITGEKYLINKLREFNIRLSLDIGAHHGLYSKLLLEKTQSKVIAFEPFKENCKKIKNLNKNNIGRISIKEIALSNERKIKKIYFFNKQSQLSSLINDINKFTYNKNKKLRYMKIKTDKLDNCIDKELKNFKSKIDLIKVDTEGHEYEVLLGAEKTIKKHKPKFIQIEMNWHNLFSNKNIFSFSKILNNYKFYIILPFNSGLRKIEVNSPNNNIYHLSNFLCVRNDIIKFF